MNAKIFAIRAALGIVILGGGLTAYSLAESFLMRRGAPGLQGNPAIAAAASGACVVLQKTRGTSWGESPDNNCGGHSPLYADCPAGWTSETTFSDCQYAMAFGSGGNQYNGNLVGFRLCCKN